MKTSLTNRTRLLSGLSGLLVGLAIYNIIFIGDHSGWAQFALGAVGLPILFIELTKILDQLGKKPEIRIGLGDPQISAADIRKQEDLHDEYTIIIRAESFALVIQNRGRNPARTVKILLEHLNREEKTYAPRLHTTTSHPFQPRNRTDFVFEDKNWILYPGENATFIFSASVQRRDHVPDPHKGGEALLRCTVWAEGLDIPFVKNLTLKGVGAYKD